MKKIMLIFVLIMLVSCTVPTNEPVKIGVIGTLSGAGAFFGQQEVKGLEIAKDMINSEGGINGRNITLIIEDSQTKNEMTVSAFNKLTDVDGVKFVIGDSMNANTAVMVPIANAKQIFVMSPTAALTSLSQDDMFFRTIPNIKEMSYYLAQQAFNDGVKTVAIIGFAANPFCVEHADYFKEEFERLGGKVVAVEYYPATQTDVKTEMTKIKELNPDAIFIPLSSTLITGPVKQMKEFGMQQKIYGAFGTESGALVKDFAQLVEGVQYPYFYDAKTTEFAEAFKQKYDVYPDATAASSYDALRIIADAISKVGEDPVKVKNYVQSQSYDLSSGKITFDKNGDANKELFMKEIKAGKFVKI